MSALIKLPPMLNVNPGVTASLPNVTQGYVYDAILLLLGGTTMPKSDITNLRIRLGGTLIWDITGADLDAINAYYKRVQNAAVLPIWFADPNGIDPATMYTGAVDTISTNFSSFQVEADIAAGAVAPQITPYALVRGQPKPQEVAGIVRSMLKSSQSFAAAQEFSVPFPHGTRGGAFLQALHVFNTNVTQLQLLRDQSPIIQYGGATINQYTQAELTRAIQAGLVSADAMVRNDMADLIPTLRPDGTAAGFDFKVSFSAADNIRLYSELLANPAAI